MKWTLHNRESHARWQHERRQDARHERWQENNPECDNCGQREHVDRMTDVSGEDWCTYCTDDTSHICIKCGERYPDSMMNWTDCGDHFICVDCDDRDLDDDGIPLPRPLPFPDQWPPSGQ